MLIFMVLIIYYQTLCLPNSSVDQDSIVSIVTCYRLDGPGIKSRGGQDFPHLSRPALGPTHPPVKWALDLFARGKVARLWH
jgi:hypothetical protein